MRKAASFFSVLVLLFFVCGCTTTSAGSDITPLSLYSTRRFASENRLFFVGEGQADTQRQAELLAYVDLNNKIYRYLGIDAEPESYRELSTLGTIVKYDARIQERTSYGSDGEFTYAFVASADKSLLDKDRSSDMQQEEEIAQRAVQLILSGDEYIKSNNDVEGLKCYLQSMELSYGLQYIEEEFSFSSILEEVLSVLDAISISLSNENQEKVSCTVKVVRHDAIIPSRVKNSTIKTTFNSEDSRGQEYTDSFMYTTDAKGMIAFIPRTPNLAKKGTITFGFDFEDEIKAIEKLSPSTADVLRNAVLLKEVKFDYNRSYSVGTVAICAQSFGLNGISGNDSSVGNLMVEKYAESDIDAFVFDYVEDESEEELLARFREQCPGTKDLIILRVGVSDVFETRMDISSISVEGTVVVYDTYENKKIYDSGITYANGFGQTVEEAQSTAFANYVLKMLSLLRAYYV